MRRPTFPFADSRGTAQLEYVIALCLVALGLSLALIVAGVQLSSLFRFQAAWLRLPVP